MKGVKAGKQERHSNKSGKGSGMKGLGHVSSVEHHKGCVEDGLRREMVGTEVKVETVSYTHLTLPTKRIV